MYRIIRFGTQNLEYYNQVDDIGSGETPTSYQDLAEGGALDNFGNLQKWPGAVERVKSLRIAANSRAELEEIYFRLVGMSGRREKLYRRLVNGEYQWIYARLAAVEAMRNYEQAQFRTIQDVDLHFVTQEATWHGAYVGTFFLDSSGVYLDSGYFFDSGVPVDLVNSPESFTLSVGQADDAGRAPVRAMVIIVEAGDAGMSDVVISRTYGETIHFGGTIPAGGHLTINTGTMQVTVNGEEAYSYMEFGTADDLAAWFSLLAGDNMIHVEWEGGGDGARIEFSFFEAWH